MSMLVEGYRHLVADLAEELQGSDHSDPEAITGRVARMLSVPTAAEVLAVGGTVPSDLIDRVASMVVAFAPGPASTSTSLGHHIEILLLQQIDLAWWVEVADLPDQAAIESDDGFVDMLSWRRDGRIKFSFSLASDKLVPRARNFAIRRLFPDWSPGTPGPSTALARPEMVRLLNHIAIEFSHQAGPEVPPMWVNCITRSVTDQCRLQELGFSAHLPSAHCRGWAADLEVDWFSRFGARDTLIGILREYQREGLINAIDEGRIWHVSPNPAAITEWSL